MLVIFGSSDPAFLLPCGTDRLSVTPVLLLGTIGTHEFGKAPWNNPHVVGDDGPNHRQQACS